MISSSPTTDLLPGLNILVASTKTVRSVHWLFIQNRTYQLLHLSRKFSLLLLCSIGSEAYPAELKDGRFWSSRAKSSEIWGRNIVLSRPTTHSVPTCSTPGMTWREELIATTTSDTPPLRYRRDAWKHVPPQSQPKLSWRLQPPKGSSPVTKNRSRHEEIKIAWQFLNNLPRWKLRVTTG
jgi:hypothetical protein